MAERAGKAAITIIENTYIELDDGVKLSARVWMPSGADENNPVSAIFEFLPYRKRDMTTKRDEVTYQNFAMHGYAGVRVDMRGCGDSTGLPQDEYAAQEQDDAVECIGWISRQLWCTGNVGMMGISWGGFNSLQVAARQPEALKAIISIGFTDDRYSDDIHFKGGVMLLANTSWAADMEAYFSIPPDPLFSDDWKEKWIERLNNIPPLTDRWLSHQTRDSYWKHGSVCEDYSKIKAAAFLFGGYADGYVNTVTRTLSNIQCPKRAIIGPWLHQYPNITAIGPHWGFCTEAIRWWDRWLKEADVDESAELVAYIQNKVPVPCPETVDGRWVQQPLTESRSYKFGDNGKLGTESGSAVIEFDTEKTCWHQPVTFFSVDLGTMPQEQSANDENSCLFETEAFTDTTDFLGQPVVTLSVASDKEFASFFLRLCLVDPEGRSRLICYTACNLNHDESHENVTPLEKGVFKTVKVPLDYIGESVHASYKLRLALSGSFFPTFVPNPEPTTFQLDVSKCQMDMQVMVNNEPLATKIPHVTNCKPMEYVMRKPGSFNETVTVGEDGRQMRYSKSYAGEKEFKAHGLITEWTTEESTSLISRDPTSAKQNIIHELNWSRGEEWKTNIRYTLDFTMDKEHFYTQESEVAKHNGEVVFSNGKKNVIPRNGT